MPGRHHIATAVAAIVLAVALASPAAGTANKDVTVNGHRVQIHHNHSADYAGTYCYDNNCELGWLYVRHQYQSGVGLWWTAKSYNYRTTGIATPYRKELAISEHGFGASTVLTHA